MKGTAIGLVNFLDPMLLRLADDALAPRRVLHPADSVHHRSKHHRTPRGNTVVEIPALEREREAAPHCKGLPEHLEATRAAALDPLHAALVDAWVLGISGNHVVKYRPPRLFRQPLLEREVLLGIDNLSNLDNPLLTFPQHAREVENVLVTHSVGHHW